MNEHSIKHLEDKVLFCLKKWPETRNKDTRLMLYIVMEYMPKYLVKQDKKHPDGRPKWWIDTEALYFIREDSVKRIRARIQNDRHMFLPTDPEVRLQRRINEEVWHEYCSTQTA